MGVLLLTVMGILAGLYSLNLQRSTQASPLAFSSLKYLLISAVFFAFAVMAKPTAFIDVVVFGLLLVGFWLNTTTSLGLGIITIGAMGIVQPLYASAFISPSLGKILILIGLVILTIGIMRGLLSKKAHFGKWLSSIALWGMVFLASVFLFKTPWIVYQKSLSGDIQRGEVLKSSLLVHSSSDTKSEKKESKSESDFRPLLAQTVSLETLEVQNAIDARYFSNNSPELDIMQCKAQHYTQEELEANRLQSPGSALREDFGRYVGFHSKVFEKKGLLGGVLSVLFWQNDHCYGLNTDAVMLCNHLDQLQTPNPQLLTQLQSKVKNLNGPVGQLIQQGLDAKDEASLIKSFDELKTYALEHSIQTTTTSVNIPYRYLVPLNSVYNWSLQNLSSYYTDVGLIWIFVMMAMGAALIYALISLNKRLLLLIVASGIGWIIWWAIAAAILWYGLGLILWLILAVSVLWSWIESEEDKTTHSLLS